MIFCPICGAPGAGERCGRCGTPLAPGTVAHGAATPRDLGDTAPTRAWSGDDPSLAPTQVGGPTVPPAWPTRDASQPWPSGDPWGPPPVYPSPGQAWGAATPRPRGRRLAPLVGAGVAAAGLAVAAAVVVPRLLPASSGSAPRAATTVTITATRSTVTVPTLEAAPVTSPVPASAPPAPAAPVAVTTTTTQTVVARPAASGPDVLSGTWVVVLESLPKGEFTLVQARAKAAQLAAASGRSPLVLDSSATAPMRAGYWAIVDGPHGSEAAAYATCGAYGRVRGGECYSRDLS